MTKRTLISWNVWMSIFLVYFGVSYGSVDLGWNRYLTFALTSLVDLPSDYASIWAVDRYGRKKSTFWGLVIASLALIIAGSIPYQQTRKVSASIICRIIMAVIAKFAINVPFCTFYVWTIELFPTTIRGIAVGTSQAFGSIGSIVSSYLIWLIRIQPVLPFGIMGFVCFQAAISSLFLPETIGQSTIETMAEMDQKEDSDIVPLSQKDSVCNNKLALGEMYLDHQM